jgi:hypothetical protein
MALVPFLLSKILKRIIQFPLHWKRSFTVLAQLLLLSNSAQESKCRCGYSAGPTRLGSSVIVMSGYRDRYTMGGLCWYGVMKAESGLEGLLW